MKWPWHKKRPPSRKTGSGHSDVEKSRRKMPLSFGNSSRYPAMESPEAEEAAHHFRQFNRFARRLLESLEIDTFLKTALDLVITWAQAERGIVILFDEAGGPLFEAARNMTGGDLQQPEFEISRTVLERVRESGHALCLANALEEPGLQASESVERLQVLSIICLPLKQENRVIGVVYLDNRSVTGAFETESCQQLEELGELFAVAACRALERRQLANHVAELEHELRSRYRLEAMIGHHPRMVALFKTLAQVADTDATILIYGESGTGKELVARALHYNNRKRCTWPFVPVNCGAIPEPLLESELFGHTRGAFTGAVQDKPGWFERAGGGTIFLDEISEMALPLQVKLLRVLQTGEYSRLGSPEIHFCDVRVVAASSKNLRTCIECGQFREELFYRLNVIELELPPLRERRSDILPLAAHFLEIYGKKYEKVGLTLSPAAEAVLVQYAFPGNVRELENMIQRGVLLAGGGPIEPGHLAELLQPQPYPVAPGTLSPEGIHRAVGPKGGSQISGGQQAASREAGAIDSRRREDSSVKINNLDTGGLEGGSAEDGGPLIRYREAKQKVLAQFEKSYLESCLRRTHGNITRAAALAGINTKNFYVKMQHYGLEPHDYRPR